MIVWRVPEKYLNRQHCICTVLCRIHTLEYCLYSESIWIELVELEWLNNHRPIENQYSLVDLNGKGIKRSFF